MEKHFYDKQANSAAAPAPAMPPLGAFSAIDNDLAIENMENDFDMTAADLQDFKRQDI